MSNVVKEMYRHILKYNAKVHKVERLEDNTYSVVLIFFHSRQKHRYILTPAV